MTISHATASRIPKFMPFQESVTYSARAANDVFFPQTLTAHRKKIEKKDSPFSPEIVNTAELVWSIVQPTFTPKTDDKLTDADGVTWVVMGVTIQFNGQVFNCACRKAV